MPRSALTLGSKASKVEGLPELLSAIDKLMDWTQSPDLKDVFMDAASAFLAEARARARIGSAAGRLPGSYRSASSRGRSFPVAPGAFRDAMFIAKGDPDKPNVLFGVSYKKAPHAHWVEYGTSKMRGHFTIRNTVVMMGPRIAGIIGDGLRKMLDNILRG